MNSICEPAIWSCDTGQRIPCIDSCQLTSHDDHEKPKALVLLIFYGYGALLWGPSGRWELRYKVNFMTLEWIGSWKSRLISVSVVPDDFMFFVCLFVF